MDFSKKNPVFLMKQNNMISTEQYKNLMERLGALRRYL